MLAVGGSTGSLSGPVLVDGLTYTRNKCHYVVCINILKLKLLYMQILFIIKKTNEHFNYYYNKF